MLTCEEHIRLEQDISDKKYVDFSEFVVSAVS